MSYDPNQPFSHNPYSNQPYHAGFRPRESNGMGVAGLIISIIGLLVTCGLLCPIGLLLSVIGLFKRPRGEAIAGTIIGGLGTLAVVSVVGFIVLAGAAAGSAAKSDVERQETKDAMHAAEAEIEMFRFEHGSLPEGIEGNKLVLDHTDAWDTSLRYDVEDDGESYTIRSAGRDEEFDTEDDLTLDDFFGNARAVDAEAVEIEYGTEEAEELDFDIEADAEPSAEVR